MAEKIVLVGFDDSHDDRGGRTTFAGVVGVSFTGPAADAADGAGGAVVEHSETIMRSGPRGMSAEPIEEFVAAQLTGHGTLTGSKLLEHQWKGALPVSLEAYRAEALAAQKVALEAAWAAAPTMTAQEILAAATPT